MYDSEGRTGRDSSSSGPEVHSRDQRPQPRSSDHSERRRDPESATTKLSLLLASTLTIMAGATIAPALPSMRDHFASVHQVDLWVRLVLTLPALLIALGAPLTGAIIDRWGRLRLLFASMVLYAIAGSSGLYLDSLPAILAGRALLGVAVAGVMTSVLTLVADYYSGPERARFMGLQSAFMNGGGIVFLIGGGLLADVSWRLPFAIYLVALLTLLLGWLWMPEPARPGEAAVAEPRGTPTPRRLLVFLYAVAFGGMLVFYLIPVQIPFLLENRFGVSPTASGLAIAAATLFGTVASLSYFRAKARIGYMGVLALSFALLGAGYVGISLSPSYAAILPALSIGGLGMGLLMPNLNLWLTSETPAAIRGRALGGMSTALFLGQFLSPVAAQPGIRASSVGVVFGAAGGILIVLSGSFLVARRSGWYRT